MLSSYPKNLETWNILYGPESFGLSPGLPLRGTEEVPAAVEGKLKKGEKTIEKETPKPSVARPRTKPEEEKEERFKYLGY